MDEHDNEKFRHVREYRDSDEIHDENHLVIAKPFGHEGQQLMSTRTYIDGKASGLWESWYASGQIQDKQNYKNNSSVGKTESWYANGQLRLRFIRNNDGQLDGLQETWYINGQPESHCNYRNGKKYGLCEMWYRNGQHTGNTPDAQWETDVPGPLKERKIYK